MTNLFIQCTIRLIVVDENMEGAGLEFLSFSMICLMVKNWSDVLWLLFCVLWAFPIYPCRMMVLVMVLLISHLFDNFNFIFELTDFLWGLKASILYLHCWRVLQVGLENILHCSSRLELIWNCLLQHIRFLTHDYLADSYNKHRFNTWIYILIHLLQSLLL